MADKPRYEITNYGQTRTVPYAGGTLRLGRQQSVGTNDRRVVKIAFDLPYVEVIDGKIGKAITKLAPMKLSRPRPKKKGKAATAKQPAKRKGGSGNRSRVAAPAR